MKDKKEYWALLTIAFILGATGVAHEYNIAKFAGDIMGNSAKQWAMTISIVMAAMGLGAKLQEKVKDTHLLISLGIGQVILGTVGAIAPSLLAWVYEDNIINFGSVYYSCTIIIGTLIGMELPMITRIIENKHNNLKKSLGNVLNLDYVGALAGGLSWVYALTTLGNIKQLSIYTGIVNLLCGFIIFLFIKKSLRIRFLIPTTLIPIGLMFVSTGYNKELTKKYGAPVVYKETTPYQHIEITKDKYDKINLYINGHLQFSEKDEYIYHQNLVHPPMAMHPNPKSVLILGGGDGLAAREVLKYKGVEKIKLVDLDPVITRLAKTNKDLLEMNEGSLNKIETDHFDNLNVEEEKEINLKSKTKLTASEETNYKVKVINADAYGYLEKSKETWDVIIIDFPDPNSWELVKLYSQEFYKIVHNKLNTGGIICQQTSSVHVVTDCVYNIQATATSAGFKPIIMQDYVPTFGGWSWIISKKEGEIEPKDLVEIEKNIPKLDYLNTNIIAGNLFNRGKPNPVDQRYKIPTTLNEPFVYILYQKDAKQW